MNLPLMLLTVPQAGQIIICVAGDYFSIGIDGTSCNICFSSFY